MGRSVPADERSPGVNLVDSAASVRRLRPVLPSQTVMRRRVFLGAVLVVVAVLGGCGGGGKSAATKTACEIWASVTPGQTQDILAMSRLDDMTAASSGKLAEQATALRDLISSQAPPDQQLAATDAINQTCGVTTTSAPSASSVP